MIFHSICKYFLLFYCGVVNTLYWTLGFDCEIWQYILLYFLFFFLFSLLTCIYIQCAEWYCLHARLVCCWLFLCRQVLLFFSNSCLLFVCLFACCLVVVVMVMVVTDGICSFFFLLYVFFFFFRCWKIDSGS